MTEEYGACRNDITEGYITIKQTIEQLRKYLIYQLNKCFVTDIDSYSFTELIEAVSQIESTEHYNANNVKPSNIPEIDCTDMNTYNETLYYRIRYYMRLLAHYLVLKGVPTGKVAEKNSLAGLISLIDLIDVKIPSVMTVEEINHNYYFGRSIDLSYTLNDTYNNPITEGEITIESNGLLYDSIQAGEPISITPIDISEKINGEYKPIVFTITYHGSEKYAKCAPITREIIILPAKIVLDVFMTNINTRSHYYDSAVAGYDNDTWSILIKTYNHKGENLPNIPFTLSVGENEMLSDVTDDNGTCIITTVFNQAGSNTLNYTTTYENTDLMSNTTEERNITIYYYPLYQNKSTYISYAGQTTYEYDIIIKDIYTGANYDTSFDGRYIYTYVDSDFFKKILINEGKATLDFVSDDELLKIQKGQHVITWVLSGNELDTEVTILSNFIVPDTNLFFLMDTPEIYYAPLYSEYYNTNQWEPIGGKRALGHITLVDTDSNILVDNTVILNTDNNGILDIINTYKDCGLYTLVLETKSDNLQETISYEYEIRKPFEIIFHQDTYNKKIKAEYTIRVYDKDEYNIGDYINCLSFNNDILNYCIVNESEHNDFYDIDITIPAKQETYGRHILTFELNEYVETSHFKLIEKNFKLLNNTGIVGNNIIQLQCYDSDINSLTIENNDVIVNSITQENDIFIVDIDFKKSGNIVLQINADNDVESFNMTIAKGNVDCSILIKKDSREIESCYYSELNQVQVSLLINNTIYDDINVIYGIDKDRRYYTDSYTYLKETINNKIFIIPSTIKPNTYDIKFEYNAGSNSNYNSFVKTKSFVVNKDIPSLKIDEQYSAYLDT